MEDGVLLRFLLKNLQWLEIKGTLKNIAYDEYVVI